jgi:hypothetical protein
MSGGQVSISLREGLRDGGLQTGIFEETVMLRRGLMDLLKRRGLMEFPQLKHRDPPRPSPGTACVLAQNVDDHRRLFGGSETLEPQLRTRMGVYRRSAILQRLCRLRARAVHLRIVVLCTPRLSSSIRTGSNASLGRCAMIRFMGYQLLSWWLAATSLHGDR